MGEWANGRMRRETLDARRETGRETLDVRREAFAIHSLIRQFNDSAIRLFPIRQFNDSPLRPPLPFSAAEWRMRRESRRARLSFGCSRRSAVSVVRGFTNRRAARAQTRESRRIGERVSERRQARGVGVLLFAAVFCDATGDRFIATDSPGIWAGIWGQTPFHPMFSGLKRGLSPIAGGRIAAARWCEAGEKQPR